jgi:hypothetical protein
MRRREFIALLVSAATLVTPSEAWSQEAGTTYRLGVLVQARCSAAHWVASFEALHNNGFTAGVNLSIVGGFSTPLNRAI